MGLWGAAQAAAFAAGGVFGTSLVDLIRYVYGSPQIAFATVFCAEAALFFLSAALAAQINRHENRSTRHATVVTA
jgi:BCD family chlorophyll transporter-like MFS transporter